MNSAELSSLALTQIDSAEAPFRAPALSEKQKRNAGRVMREIISQRLQGCSAVTDHLPLGRRTRSR